MPPISRRDLLVTTAGMLAMPAGSALGAGSAGDRAALPPPAATEVWQPVPPKVDAPVNGAPSDAKVLFSGTDTDAWEHADAG
ncbi:MAG TPA: hypothetical protein VLF15_10515, partial [Pseudoxanthomonas sp.]|nr:hypothetical protein [Pseudoxanthomonas sp.]